MNILKIILLVYVVVCGLLFFFQEKLIFHPERLSGNYTFPFHTVFEEQYITTPDGTRLHGLLFRSSLPSRGLIFYLHGNAGSLKSWGDVAQIYTGLGYDVFMLDYRGYGKSGGSISSQQQLFDDVQLVYHQLMQSYPEDRIVVLGYSIGTGPSAWLASTNHPRLLILQAPYYSLKDLVGHTFPVVPSFLLRYRFETNKYLGDCNMPVVIFHGDADEVIYYGSSVKLKALYNDRITLITLKGQQHNGMTGNPAYLAGIQHMLQ